MALPKPIAEPFHFGKKGIISSQSQARKILKDNSWYFYAVGLIDLIIYIIDRLSHSNTEDINILIFFSIANFLLGFFIGEVQSRIASCAAFLLYFVNVVIGLVYYFFEWPVIMNIILCAASYRCVKASFYFYK